MSTGHNTHRAGGFTLLELLVVAMLLSLVATMALGGLRTGVRVWERTADRAAEEMDAAALRGFLHRLLEDARPVHLRDGSRNPPVLFDGNPQAALFVAALPVPGAPPEQQLVRLVYADGTLRLQWHRPEGATLQVDFTETEEEILMTGLTDLRFSYDGAPRHAPQPRLPGLIEVHMSTASGPLAPVAVAPQAGRTR